MLYEARALLFGFMEALLPVVLLIQGILGGFDTLLNHDFIEQLAKRPEARGEIGLHAIREALWAVLLGGLGWLAWQGAAAVVIGAVLGAEIVISTIDEFVENRVRVLPQNERVLHVLLLLNTGVLAALLFPVLIEWHASPTALVPSPHGWMSWLLLALATASAEWAVLDFIAWLRLGGAQPEPSFAR
jgi:hypothetical protein